MKKISIISIYLLFFALSVFAQTKSSKEERFINDLLRRMTIEEKLGQMNQMHFNTTVDSMCMKVRNGEIGSLLNIDPKLINQIQRTAVKESRLGIPMIIGRDVIHGYKTIFPIPLGQAASFNPQIPEDGARVAATESRQQGITWTFAPMLDISRDPRWGRIAESLGEDPYLTSIMGASMVRGFQGNNLKDNNAMAACVKHFVGYGAAEGGRDYNSTNIPIRLLRNVYLPPFQKAIETGAATVMTSFNDNDGIPSSGDDFLLRTVLRKEWKFDGFVVSDWESMSEMIKHGYAQDKKDVARISLKAGMDMEMVSETYVDYIKDLLREKKVSIKEVDNAVRNILRIKYRLGLFENPYVDEKAASAIYAPEHLQKARQAAVESAVLLQNKNQILPLKPTTKIAVIGPMANAAHDQLGTWSFDGDKNKTITPLKALQTEYSNINYVYEPGLTYSRDKNTNFEKAISAANSADVAIVIVGEEAILSGEAHSLSNINLIGQQSELLRAIKNTGKPVVMVVIAGRPLTIERDLPNADAVLYSFHPGTMGGLAIMDLLFGKENPSGKLPVTFVREVGQIPIYYNHNNTGRPAQDWMQPIDEIPLEAPQTSLGNTSFYLDSGKEPLFPFGFGLSYSKFEYTDLQLLSTEISTTGSVTAKATVKNTSNVDGYEVVQLYVRDLVGSIARPVKELKGFQKIFLKAGESKTVEFHLKASELAFYGRDLVKKTEPGEFKIWISKNSHDNALESSFFVK
jgi:beta-glucosidase